MKTINNYIKLIQAANKVVDILVITSINCVNSHEWTAFANRLQDAGADVLELNMFFLPSDFERTSLEQENANFKIDKVLASVYIQVVLNSAITFPASER